MAGLYNKYNVTKADGSPVEGEYFVLKFDDPLAKAALQCYALIVEEIDPQLTKDIYDRVGNDLITYASWVDVVTKKLKEILKTFE